MAIYDIENKPARRRPRRDYQKEPHWSLLRHAVRNCAQHGPYLGHFVSAEDVAGEVLPAHEQISGAGLLIVREALRGVLALHPRQEQSQ
jgi:hypothetical protein